MFEQEAIAAGDNEQTRDIFDKVKHRFLMPTSCDDFTLAVE